MRYGRFVIAGASATFVVLGAASALAAQTDTSSNVKTIVQPTAASTTGTTNAVAKIACVGTAVNTRETTLDAAMATFTGASNAAYTARASALKQAYTATTTRGVSTAVKTAWTTFNSAVKSARKAWQAARDTAWQTYRTSATACKAPAGTGDGVNSTSEASGN